MLQILSAVSLYILLLAVQIGFMYVPELPARMMQGLSFLYAGIVTTVGALYFMRLEQELLPKDIHSEAQEVFATRQPEDLSADSQKKAA